MFKWLLDNTDHALIPGCILADGARIFFRDVEAPRAEDDPILYLDDGFSKRQCLLSGCAKQEVGHPRC